MIFILSVSLLNAQNRSSQAADRNCLSLVFYNTENLFDTEDDPEVMDDEFTPGGKKKWNKQRYEKKLDNIARALYEAGTPGGCEDMLPDLIGLAEVENKKVLMDLASTERFIKGNYGIVHYDSPDIRGIDVALMYNKNRFSIETTKSISIRFPGDSILVRDILMVECIADNSERFFLFVNHWKSRSGGQAKTEKYRKYSAVRLRMAVDSVFNSDIDARIIIMGDFNDEPTNNSVNQILRANNKRKNYGNRELYNLMYDMHNMGDSGTYSYRGSWNMLDQIIISRSVLEDRDGFHTDYNGGKIFKAEWLLYNNSKAGTWTPNKTYGGKSYYGGISDHLPVYMVLWQER